MLPELPPHAREAVAGALRREAATQRVGLNVSGSDAEWIVPLADAMDSAASTLAGGAPCVISEASKASVVACLENSAAEAMWAGDHREAAVIASFVSSL